MVIPFDIRFFLEVAATFYWSRCAVAKARCASLDATYFFLFAAHRIPRQSIFPTVSSDFFLCVIFGVVRFQQRWLLLLFFASRFFWPPLCFYFFFRFFYCVPPWLSSRVGFRPAPRPPLPPPLHRLSPDAKALKWSTAAALALALALARRRWRKRWRRGEGCVASKKNKKKFNEGNKNEDALRNERPSRPPSTRRPSFLSSRRRVRRTNGHRLYTVVAEPFVRMTRPSDNNTIRIRTRLWWTTTERVFLIPSRRIEESGFSRVLLGKMVAFSNQPTVDRDRFSHPFPGTWSYDPPLVERERAGRRWS